MDPDGGSARPGGETVVVAEGPVDVLDRGRALAAAGRYRRAVDELTAAHRVSPHPDLAAELVRIRYEAARHVRRLPAPQPWPRPSEDRFAGVEGAPEVDVDDLDVDTFRSAVDHHGCLLVRRLFRPERVGLLVDGIERSIEAVAAAMAEGRPTAAPWFVPFEAEGVDLGGEGRMWGAVYGTLWAAESPLTFHHMLEGCDEAGLRRLLARYFGEPPFVSVMKTSLRRVPPDAPGGWHQDAYVYGVATRAVNLWVALSDCGPEVAPGLDLIPRRFDDLVEDLPAPPPLVPIADATIEALSRATPVQRPTFRAGDALLFDTLVPHQTGIGPSFTQARYGLECWFFAPSTCPDEWVPLLY